VRQFFEQYYDKEKAWRPWFEGFYGRVDAAASASRQAGRAALLFDFEEDVLLNEKIRYGRFPASNPVANALMAVVGALAVGAAIIFGFFMFLLLAGLVLVLAAIVGIRIWWAGRKLRKLQETAAKPNAGRAAGQPGIIEGEYHVVATRRNREPR